MAKKNLRRNYYILNRFQREDIENGKNFPILNTAGNTVVFKLYKSCKTMKTANKYLADIKSSISRSKKKKEINNSFIAKHNEKYFILSNVI